MKVKGFLIGLIFLLAGSFGCGSNHQAGHNHYAGEEKREIKSLSDEEIKNLREGNGMGLAKSAELNGYPGPKHILENESQMNLTAEQKQKVSESFQNMKKDALKLGHQILEKEKEFDLLFSRNEINEELLKTKTQEIAGLKGDLRSVHLQAHLEMKKLLTTEQIKKYNELRGYAN